MDTVKVYGVLHGRQGSRVYDTWRECQDALFGVDNARYRSFSNKQKAWDWIYEQGEPPNEDEPIMDDAEMEEFFSEDDINQIEILKDSPLDKTEPATDPPPIVLSDEQQSVIRLCERGESLFFTGSAGTGKSVCLREIIKRLRLLHGEDSVYVTASTGIAAINVGGTTLHSFAGIRLGKESVGVLTKKMSKAARSRWNSCDVLIVDEISMIDGKLFDKLEILARIIRGRSEPFGGIQLILCGDFFQLPPVEEKLSSGQKVPIKFAFEADKWDQCVRRVVVLKKVFRQKEDKFINLLNMMRKGEIDRNGISIFKELERELDYQDGIKPTELFALRAQVEQANDTRLQELQGPEYSYYARDFPGYDMEGKALSRDKASKLLDNTLAARVVRLRVGAQVMLIKNTEEKFLVNGSIGTIIGFEEKGKGNKPEAKISTADDRSKHRPEEVQVQVNLNPTCSQSSAGLSSSGSHQSNINSSNSLPSSQAHADSGSISGDIPLSNGTTDKGYLERPRWPIVKFENGAERQLSPAPFEAVTATGELEADRLQIPLILAWALSIHKSQGQTLSRVKVNMDGIFEKGQAYVAVSRATSLKGLQVLKFTERRVMVHPRVLNWSKTVQEMKEPAPMAVDDEEEYWREFDDI